MRLRTQLSALTIILIALFILSVGGMFYVSSSATGMKDAQREVMNVHIDWLRLKDAGASIFLASGANEELVEGYLKAAKAFTDRMNAFGTLRLFDSLGPDVATKVKNIQNLWELLKLNLATAQSALTNMINEDMKVKLASLGDTTLMYGMIKLSGNGNLSTQEIYSVYRFQSGLQSLIYANESFDKLVTGLIADIGTRADSSIGAARLLFLLLMAVLVIGSCWGLILFNRRLAKGLNGIEKAMALVAAKDFSIPDLSVGDDEIGSLAVHLNATVGQLGALFSSVRSAVSKVTELKDTLSAGTTESAASLNQIQKNIESIGSRFVTLDGTITQAADSVRGIGENIVSMDGQVDAQAKAVQDASASMEQISRSIESVSALTEQRKKRADELQAIIANGGEKISGTNSYIQSIAKDVDNIIEIIDLINSVSDQTHILSMNAAIESAHAGEAGKGFAVVADEIRKLADTTTENADRIAQSLRSITDKIRAALQASQAGLDSFENISADMNDFVAAMTEIAANMGEVAQGSSLVLHKTQDITEATRRIGDASKEMSNNIRMVREDMGRIGGLSGEVVSGIKEIDLGSREVLQAMVQVNSMSNESRDRVQSLAEALAGFKTREGSQ